MSGRPIGLEMFHHRLYGYMNFFYDELEYTGVFKTHVTIMVHIR